MVSNNSTDFFIPVTVFSQSTGNALFFEYNASGIVGYIADVHNRHLHRSGGIVNGGSWTTHCTAHGATALSLAAQRLVRNPGFHVHVYCCLFPCIPAPPLQLLHSGNGWFIINVPTVGAMVIRCSASILSSLQQTLLFSIPTEIGDWVFIVGHPPQTNGTQHSVADTAPWG